MKISSESVIILLIALLPDKTIEDEINQSQRFHFMEQRRQCVSLNSSKKSGHVISSQIIGQCYI